jgi:hypothetical protein
MEILLLFSALPRFCSSDLRSLVAGRLTRIIRRDASGFSLPS